MLGSEVSEVSYKSSRSIKVMLVSGGNSWQGFSVAFSQGQHIVMVDCVLILMSRRSGQVRIMCITCELIPMLTRSGWVENPGWDRGGRELIPKT